MKTNKTLVGFAGRKRSGKGVLANMLKEEYNAKIITVADYLKRLCCEILEVDYDTLNRMKDSGDVITDFPLGRMYNIVNDKVGLSKNDIFNVMVGVNIKNVREMLQVIGTDIIRRYKPDWHVWQMQDEIKSYADNTVIAIDDVRFPNERKAIESYGGKCFFIIRPDNDDISNHISETSLTWEMFDDESIIINHRDVDHLKSGFKKMYDTDYEFNFSQYVSAYKKDYDKDLKTVFKNTSNPLVRENIKVLF